VPEVLDLRELGGDDPRRDSPTAAGAEPASGALDWSAASGWRRWAALAVVLVLFLAVAYVLGVGRSGVAPTREKQNATPGEVAAAQGARDALDAWARFASSGDLDQLRGPFDPAGPQLARLKAEAPGVAARAAGGAYSFSAEVLGVNAGRNRDEQLVGADVVVSRSGESDQRFTWELVLRRSEERWLLWTVRDQDSASRSASIGGAP
jgi:hypothetical protein